MIAHDTQMPPPEFLVGEIHRLCRSSGDFRLDTRRTLSAQTEDTYAELVKQKRSESVAKISIGSHYLFFPRTQRISSSNPVQSGYIQFLVKLRDMWRLADADLAVMLGFDPNDKGQISRLLQGFSNVEGRDLKDRFAYLLQIRMLLDNLLQDLEEENKWLREPHSMLDNRTPMSLLLEGSMRDLIVVAQYVEMACGL